MVDDELHVTIVGYGTEDQHGQRYKIRMTKTRCTIPRMKRLMKAIPISADDNLRNEMSKFGQPQTDDKFNKLVECFSQLHKHEHSYVMEMEMKDAKTDICTVQPQRHVNLECSETIRQKCNWIKETEEHNKHIIKKILHLQYLDRCTGSQKDFFIIRTQ